MPWKGEKDPYRIWLSEIILQQTRVEQGEKYYKAILQAYPDIAGLAAANENQVYSLWQGLGYYNRCRNMLYAAKQVMHEFGGRFPTEYEDIISLKGIGTYTAAAIASFAYNKPYAVVDGNVVRVLSRYFGICSNFYTLAGKKEFETLAQSLLDRKHPALYNQAIMDLGATVCKPAQPLCHACPLSKNCTAFTLGIVQDLPYKKKRAELKDRHFHFFTQGDGDELLLVKRRGNDIWRNLYTLYSIETKTPDRAELPEYLRTEAVSRGARLVQKLSHQKIHGYFYDVDRELLVLGEEEEWLEVAKKDLKKYALPKMIISFFENNHYL